MMLRWTSPCFRCGGEGTSPEVHRPDGRRAGWTDVLSRWVGAYLMILRGRIPERGTPRTELAAHLGRGSVPHLPRRPRRALLVGGATALAVLVLAPSAGAGILVKTATGCGTPTYERPFLRWADIGTYVLAPDGNLEGATTQWSLSGGAAVTSGNESYNVHGPGETHSLALPSGSSATTAAMCVGVLHPTLRLFARNTGAFLSALSVDALVD